MILLRGARIGGPDPAGLRRPATPPPRPPAPPGARSRTSATTINAIPIICAVDGISCSWIAADSTPTTGVASDAIPATPAGSRERMNIQSNQPSAPPPTDMNAIAR